MFPETYDAYGHAKKLYTADMISKMSLEEYARVREELLGAAREDKEATAVTINKSIENPNTCMWCAKGFSTSEEVEAHEAVCGT
jgi:hypothetical protein